MNGIPFPESEFNETSTSSQKDQVTTTHAFSEVSKSKDWEKVGKLKPMRIILLEDYQKGKLMTCLTEKS